MHFVESSPSPSYDESEMSSLYFTIDPAWEGTIQRWTTEKLRCRQCDNFFFEIDNLGAWKCSQHALDKPPHVGLPWPCCKKRLKGVAGMASRGCVKADHTTNIIPFDEQHDVSIPIPLKDFVGIYAQSKVVTEDSNLNKITIRRFDWNTADGLGRNALYPIDHLDSQFSLFHENRTGL